MEPDFLSLETKIIEILKTVFDPEIPVNVYDLGLIYNIETNEEGMVKIEMTLTAPNCPMADMLVWEVKEKTGSIEGVKGVDVNLTFDPPWDMERMTEEAKLELGML